MQADLSAGFYTFLQSSGGILPPVERLNLPMRMERISGAPAAGGASLGAPGMLVLWDISWLRDT